MKKKIFILCLFLTSMSNIHAEEILISGKFPKKNYNFSIEANNEIILNTSKSTKTITTKNNAKFSVTIHNNSNSKSLLIKCIKIDNTGTLETNDNLLTKGNVLKIIYDLNNNHKKTIFYNNAFKDNMTLDKDFFEIPFSSNKVYKNKEWTEEKTKDIKDGIITFINKYKIEDIFNYNQSTMIYISCISKGDIFNNTRTKEGEAISYGIINEQSKAIISLDSGRLVKSESNLNSSINIVVDEKNNLVKNTIIIKTKTQKKLCEENYENIKFNS